MRCVLESTRHRRKTLRHARLSRCPQLPLRAHTSRLQCARLVCPVRQPERVKYDGMIPCVAPQITVDMDVLGRLELLQFFKQECAERGCTIVYATHIFDGLADWMTHLLFISNGHVVKAGSVDQIPELQEQKVLHVASKWLRTERDRLRQQPRKAAPNASAAKVFSSRQMAFFQ